MTTALTFDAAALVTRLGTTFQSGRTRAAEWREQQLGALQTMLDAREAEFLDALATDLGQASAEAYATEVGFVKNDVRLTYPPYTAWKERLLRKVL